MIFVCNQNGNHSVWDAKNQRELCKFVDGKFETSDEYKIKILELNGYKKLEEKKENTKIDIENKTEIKTTKKRTYNRKIK